MRFLKLFIAAIVLPGSICLSSPSAVGVEVNDENKLIPQPETATTSIGEIATAHLDVANTPIAESGAISSEEPAQAALRITPTIPNGTPFTPPIVLPAATPAPEPGAAMIAAAMMGLLLRRRSE